MLKQNPKILILFIVLLFSFVSHSQTKTFSPKGSFSVDIGVPAKPHNKAFERTMEGLLNGGIDYRYNAFKGLTIGAGLKYSLFTLNSFAFTNTAISGGYQMPGAYLIVGYEKFTTERVSFTGSIRGGYSFLMSFNDSCSVKPNASHISETFFLEPQVEVTMFTEKASEHAFSFVIGYDFYFHEFKSEDVCMSEIGTLLPESYDGITRYLSIGFGYRYYMGRK